MNGSFGPPSGDDVTKSAGFGKVLRYLRERRGLVQEEVAKRIGVNRSQIPKWERERQGMRLESLVEVLEALGSDLEEFGRYFGRMRRGQPLEDEAAEDGSLGGREDGDTKQQGSRGRGRAAIFLWEEATEEEIVGPLKPEDPRELGLVMRDLRHALDQLRPPEEREELRSEREAPMQPPEDET